MPARDADRPPVLAHQRFQENRAGFADLDLTQRLQRIRDTNLWGAETSMSGLGSQADATTVLRHELPRLLARRDKSLGVWRIADLPLSE